MTFAIRERGDADDGAIWRILEPVIGAGEVYALPRNLSREDALAYWNAAGHHVFVAETTDGTVAGTYWIRANARGGGSHVANAGYATHEAYGGRGIASAMYVDSLERARELGFTAMQFNFVVSTNAHAVALWRKHGFAIAGTLPGAFAHPSLGYVDVFVMFRDLRA